MRTTSLKLKDLDKKWYLIDCTDMIIGRVSTKVATILQGKHKLNYAPNLNNGDHVILINTSKIKWTGNKKGEARLYRRHSGYQGGLKEISLDTMVKKNPNVILEHSISKMLPKNKMRDVYMAQLHCFAGADHKHVAQSPEMLEL
jgi:large subunit ribosomal protein L13